MPVPPHILAPGQAPFHQPNFAKIEGTVVAWHPWAPTDDCPPARHTYTVGGHIHFRPPPPPGGGGPERLAETDACEFWWLVGEPPGNLGEQDCTEKMRGLARRFLERIVAPYVQNAPEQWAWLPALGSVDQMSIPQLLGPEGALRSGDGCR